MSGDWSGMGWNAWTDHEIVRARLSAGADPNTGALSRPPLHYAAEYGSPEVVAELAARVDDVDAMAEGRSALWLAVYGNRPDNAGALVAAGADPWRPMMAGWSPGRLALAGPTPGLFGSGELSPAEAAAAAEAPRLIAALGQFHYESTGLACVAGVTAADAARRLDATVATFEDDEDYDDDEDEDDEDDDGWEPWDNALVGDSWVVGATDVPGGCVITQPWGPTPQVPGVIKLLSAGTVCYGLYASANNGNRGTIVRDGQGEGWDLHPGGDVSEQEPADRILLAYLYRHNAVAFSCAFAGLRLTDARAVTGPPDVWLRLPEADYWQ